MGVLVVLKAYADRDAWFQSMLDAGVPVEEVVGLPRHFLVDQDIDTFSATPEVEFVEPDDLPIKGAVDQALDIAADFTTGSWAIARTIRRSAPWPVNRSKFPWSTFFRCARDGTGVDVYSLDSGIRPTHTEFGIRVTNVYEFYSSGGAGDNFGHGTQTASAACGATVGLARGALIFSFKCLDGTGGATNTSLTTAIGQLITHYNGRAATGRPAVVNMSLQGFTAAVASAVTDMINAGIVVVASAGNSGQDLATSDQYPAESDAEVIVVGGVGPFDQSFYAGDGNASNFGTRIDVSGPSMVTRVATNSSDSSFNVVRGTSYGCGFTTGVVACLLQGHPRLTGRTQVAAVRTHLRNIATTGKLKVANGITLPDRLLYLDPNQAAPEAITGL